MPWILQVQVSRTRSISRVAQPLTAELVTQRQSLGANIVGCVLFAVPKKQKLTKIEFGSGTPVVWNVSSR